MVLGGGAFGRWLVSEGEALMSGINALIKGTPESSLVLSVVWGPREKRARCEPRRRPSPDTRPAGPWSWTSASRSVVHKPSGVWNSVTAAWADQDTESAPSCFYAIHCPLKGTSFMEKRGQSTERKQEPRSSEYSRREGSAWRGKGLGRGQLQGAHTGSTWDHLPEQMTTRRMTGESESVGRVEGEGTHRASRRAGADGWPEPGSHPLPVSSRQTRTGFRARPLPCGLWKKLALIAQVRWRAEVPSPYTLNIP